MNHPFGLNLPRNDDGLATGPRALRRVTELVPTVLEEFVDEVGVDGVVLTLDGGVDTTVAASLAVDAVGADRVMGLVIPSVLDAEAAVPDAEAVASTLDVHSQRLGLDPLLAAFQHLVGKSDQPTDDLVATHNVVERLRMACTYYVANTSDAIVVGAANRTTRLLGPTTKYGAIAVDCLLLGDLFRTEVDALARRMNVPDSILDRCSQRDLATGETNAERLGVSPRTVDRALRLSVDEKLDRRAVADELDIDPAIVERIETWCAETRHKRHTPMKPSKYV